MNGELDVANAAAFRDALASLIESSPPGTSVVVDTARLSFIDSTGLGVLVGTRRRAMERGMEMVIANPTPATERVMEITGLATLFEIRHDTEDR